MSASIEVAPGALCYPGDLDRAGQAALREEILAARAAAPAFTPRPPRTGMPFSVRMSECGPPGWVSDAESGRRRQPTHPETGAPQPPPPARFAFHGIDRVYARSSTPIAGGGRINLTLRRVTKG